jgi:hypothetical protein
MSEPKTGREGRFGEPWRIDERDFGLVDSRECEVEVGLPEFDRRIVSCVNTLSDIEDPAAWREAVEALIEAAGAIADWHLVETQNEAAQDIKRLRAAIARVQGGRG